uniref:Uncharacterized protein n=1 Tax=Triticum urartu TaxID=4572 RepID=A0A8R7UNZ5_TRIUA
MDELELERLVLPWLLRVPPLGFEKQLFVPFVESSTVLRTVAPRCCKAYGLCCWLVCVVVFYRLQASHVLSSEREKPSKIGPQVMIFIVLWSRSELCRLQIHPVEIPGSPSPPASLLDLDWLFSLGLFGFELCILLCLFVT